MRVIYRHSRLFVSCNFILILGGVMALSTLVCRLGLNAANVRCSCPDHSPPTCSARTTLVDGWRGGAGDPPHGRQERPGGMGTPRVFGRLSLTVTARSSCAQTAAAVLVRRLKPVSGDGAIRRMVALGRQDAANDGLRGVVGHPGCVVDEYVNAKPGAGAAALTPKGKLAVRR
jgi:hypothetical protein